MSAYVSRGAGLAREVSFRNGVTVGAEILPSVSVAIGIGRHEHAARTVATVIARDGDVFIDVSRRVRR